MKYLKYWRLVKGMNQKDVAKECGISQGHYCDIERGGIKPRPDLYEKLADALGRTKEELVAKLNGVDPQEMVAHGAASW